MSDNTTLILVIIAVGVLLYLGLRRVASAIDETAGLAFLILRRVREEVADALEEAEG